MSPIHPLAALARRFTIDWLDLADPDVPATIMAPDYRVHIGTVDLTGLDEYRTATLGQLRRFPGLTLTVHELVTDGDQLAMVFSEHGASVKDDLRTATWRGVALFRCADGRLAENWTQEDYYARRRQLATGEPDPVPAPAVAPWTTSPVPADPAAEDAVRAWLAAPVLDGVTVDGMTVDRVTVDNGSAPVVGVERVRVDRLFSAGTAVAVAGVWSGRYAGGLDDVEPASRQPADIGFCGVLHVEAGGVVGGQVVTDRHGLRRALLG